MVFSFISFSQGPFLLFRVGRDEWVIKLRLILSLLAQEKLKKHHKQTKNKQTIEALKRQLFVPKLQFVQAYEGQALAAPSKAPISHLISFVDEKFLNKVFLTPCVQVPLLQASKETSKRKTQNQNKTHNMTNISLTVTDSSSPWSCLSSLLP